MNDQKKRAEPLAIWFFVGVILLVYGVLLVISPFVSEARPTILGETRPALWWGAITTVAGIVFLIIGIRGHRGSRGRPNHATGEDSGAVIPHDSGK